MTTNEIIKRLRHDAAEHDSVDDTAILECQAADALARSESDRSELMRQFEFCNILLPAAEQVVLAVKKNHLLQHSLEQYEIALKQSAEVKAASVLPSERRHQDEKRDIASRLGYPLLEPWCAADKVVAERDELRAKLERSERQNAARMEKFTPLIAHIRDQDPENYSTLPMGVIEDAHQALSPDAGRDMPLLERTPDIGKALECDAAAREADISELIELLLLRHSSLLKINDDHPHKDAILKARDSAKSELRWRLLSTIGLLDWWDRHPAYTVGFAPSGSWAAFDKQGHTCYAPTSHQCLSKLQAMHSDLKTSQNKKD